MNSKIDKTNSASAKKKTAAGVPPNQPKITLFLTKQDGSNQAPPMSRRKRRRRNRHTGPSSSTPGMVLAEITLSSDSDDDMARPNSIHLKRPRTILECAADDGEEKGNSREASDASSTAAEEDAEIICDAGLSSHPRISGDNSDSDADIKVLTTSSTSCDTSSSRCFSACSAAAATATQQPQPIPPQDVFKIPSIVQAGCPKLVSETGSVPNTVSFYEADTQIIFGGATEAFNDDGNEILSNLDEEEIVKSASASPSPKPKSAFSSSVSPVQIGLSPATSSPSLISSSPVKVSPKPKPTYYSPVKYLRKEPAKRLFGSPAKPLPSQTGPPPPPSMDTSLATTSPHRTVINQLHSQSQFELLANFDCILDEVMSGGESVLFNDADFTLYRQFLCVSRPARCLYLKLFRRSLTWYRQRKIIYERIAQDLSLLFEELYQTGFFSELKDESPLPDLETLLELLDKEEMKNLAKEMNTKSGPQSSKEICKAELLKMVKTQRTLSKINSSQVLTEAVMTRLGGTFRVSEASRDFFSRVFILYSLPQYWEDETQVGPNHLLNMLLTNLGKMEYPSYSIVKTTNIFRTREDVILFKEGLALHSKIQANIEAKGWGDVLEVLDLVLEKLKDSVLMCPSMLEHDKSLPTFLRAYTAGSVLTRATWLGIEAHQKLKQFQQANERLDFLLNHNSQSYLAHYRGRWHERKIVNSKHLKLPIPEIKEHIIQALSDSCVLDDHRLGLTARLGKVRLEEKKVRERAAAKKSKKQRRQNSADVSSSETEDECETEEDRKIKSRNSFFRTYELNHSITERTIEAEQLSLRGDGERVFGKSTFLGGGSASNRISSVEDRALSFYRDLGYRSGVHGEGSVPISLYGLVFWDIIYMDQGISDVFRGPFQAFPLDLHSAEFYQNRQEKIEEMLHNLRYAWSLVDAYSVIERNWNNNANKLSVVVWNTFHSLEHVKGLVRSMGLGLLADISERLSRNFRHYRSGFPDLVVWNEAECLFVEVKGPGDKLSAKQSIWLDFLIAIGAKTEVCRVKSVSNKRIRV